MGPVNAIKTGFAKSLQFKGRAARSEFWWFAAFAGAALIVVFWPFLSFFTSEVVDRVDFRQSLVTGETTRSLRREENFDIYRIDWGAVPLLGVAGFGALVAAATVRKLHDVGSSALFGLSVLPTAPAFQVFTLLTILALSKVSFGLAAPVGAVLGLLGLLLWIICPAILIILLSRPSEDGTTEHGPNPHEVPS